MSLDLFHPVTRRWFAEALGEPTAPQRLGWPAIRAGRHTLIAAPTGSGKTLAAFLSVLDDLVRDGLEAPLPDEVRVVYVSPLKALSADVHKNLAEPRRGLARMAAAAGLRVPQITAAVRTGDTTMSERAKMLRTPPHVLVTTPESLYLLLTAERSREMLRTARTVIVDEIHAVIGTRRGAHLALSLERLQALTGRPLQRIGLSATQKPIEQVAHFLVGHGRLAEDGRADCAIVDEGHRRTMDLRLELPRSPLEAVISHETWAEYDDRLTALVEEHRTTLVFVNTRRLAERLARQLSDRLGTDAVTAHHGSLSKERRLDAERRLKEGALKALVATASLELGIDIGDVDLVCQIGSPRRIATFLQRVGRSGHSISGTPKGRLMPLSRDDLIESAALLRAVAAGELDRIVAHDAPLDVLAQQLVAEVACCDCSEDALYQLVTRAWPFRELARADFDAVVHMASEGFATRRGRRTGLVHRDEVNATLRARRRSRMVAIASGGAIPDVADYKVILEPDDTFIGTLNEDFAIESSAGDIFQLGNSSWQITQVAAGVVRVADAHGAPPTLPFWIGEAPGRSHELSRAVAALRTEIDRSLAAHGREQTIALLQEAGGLPDEAAQQAVDYLAEARRALGALPSHDLLVLERFFDESGGMQLVLHAPFGSRINRAWGLALRKRFCRQFNFELQAAATDDALLLSLGPQHSFPLADVFRYLHPTSVRDVLVQALLDAPVFQSRWRWNATISLAVPRRSGSRTVPPQLQRMLADDLMAAVFPDAAACIENIPGDREIPDHPLARQTIRDCVEEAMDCPGLEAILARIHAGDVQLLARDLPEPSVLAHEILNARPYAFLDDAPLEERRTHAVYARRASEVGAPGGLGALDPSAIDRVIDEERLDVRDAEELHDALLARGVLPARDATAVASLLDTLAASGRATRFQPSSGSDTALWVATERVPEILAIHPGGACRPAVRVPSARASRTWSAAEALAELLRSFLSSVGPIGAASLAQTLGVDGDVLQSALEQVESEGLILRGSFRGPGLEWCDRRLLARIHRYTLNRLRAEIEPVTPADFTRFLFAWHHVEPTERLKGVDGVQAVVERLDGFELAASAWEQHVLPLRVEDYQPSMLDMLCLTGRVAWGRVARGPLQVAGATPIALCLREHRAAWRRPAAGAAPNGVPMAPSALAARALDALAERGALFQSELAAACGGSPEGVREALAELVGLGLVTSDGFAGLRGLVQPARRPGADGGDSAGRWVAHGHDASLDDHQATVIKARALLRRYGVITRRLLTREPNAPSWRELVRIYRTLELQGEIRGGRFVAGFTGEQFALPEAVTRMREVRRAAPTGRLTVICGADPLNLVGIVTAGERVRATAATRLVYQDGVPLAALEGDYIRPITAVDGLDAGAVASALAGRPVPPVMAGFIGRTQTRHR